MNPEAGGLQVNSARFSTFPNSTVIDRSVVELTTLSQNELLYIVKVSGVRDGYGLPMSPRVIALGQVIDPSQASFQGTPPNEARFRDTDGDGLTDNEEQRGWVVSVTKVDGTVMTRQVTSDPGEPTLTATASQTPRKRTWSSTPATPTPTTTSLPTTRSSTKFTPTR